MYKDGRCLICGSHLMVLNKGHLKLHEKTKKHQDALKKDHNVIIKNNKVECPCGSTVNIGNYKIHCNSQVHKRYLKYFHNNISYSFLENN